MLGNFKKFPAHQKFRRDFLVFSKRGGKMLSKKDLIVLSHLRNDSRETLTKMSRKTSIPVSTLFDRIRMHENSIIKRYTAILDFTQLGYNSRAKIIIKVKREEREDVENYLQKHENINSLYKINNGYDFLVEGIFKHIKEVEDFMEQLEIKFKIKSSQVYYIIEDIKREEFLSDPELVDVVE